MDFNDERAVRSSPESLHQQCVQKLKFSLYISKSPAFNMVLVPYRLEICGNQYSLYYYYQTFVTRRIRSLKFLNANKLVFFGAMDAESGLLQTLWHNWSV